MGLRVPFQGFKNSNATCSSTDLFLSVNMVEANIVTGLACVATKQLYGEILSFPRPQFKFRKTLLALFWKLRHFTSFGLPLQYFLLLNFPIEKV